MTPHTITRISNEKAESLHSATAARPTPNSIEHGSGVRALGHPHLQQKMTRNLRLAKSFLANIAAKWISIGEGSNDQDTGDGAVVPVAGAYLTSFLKKGT